MTEYDAVSREPLVAAAVGFALMGVLLFVIFDKATTLHRAPEAVDRRAAGSVRQAAEVGEGSTQALGWYLFKTTWSTWNWRG